MNDVKQERELIRQFLVAELTEERRQQVEERLMTDSVYRDEILMVESELVEDYLNETLLPGERDRFEKHYLSAPRQQQNLRLTKALFKAAESAKPLPAPKMNLLGKLIDLFQWRNPRMRLVTVSLVLLAVVGAAVLFQAWRQRVQRDELRAELVQLNTTQKILSPNETVPSVTLQPLNLREQGALPTVTVSAGAKVLQLRVPIASNAYQSYRVKLRTIEGEEIVEFDAQKQIGDVQIVQLPAHLLKPDDYLLSVSGSTAPELTETLGEFSFRVLQP